MSSAPTIGSMGRRAALHPHRRGLVWLNVLGGIAVLGSYARDSLAHASSVGAVWGGVPDALRPLYTVSMFAAVAGYFAFTSVLVLDALVWPAYFPT